MFMGDREEERECCVGGRSSGFYRAEEYQTGRTQKGDTEMEAGGVTSLKDKKYHLPDLRIETTENRRVLEEREKICKSQHAAVQPVPSFLSPPVQPVPGSQDPAVEQPVPGFPSPPVQPVPGSQDPAVEFVDQHREALIQRVTLVKPIADALLQRKLLQEEAYDKICAEKTSQDQMRTLYQFLKSSTVKSALYAELLKKEPFLVNDLGAV
ncbi:hypothetical protein AGOR_G00153050 [Albula goreensis]|uniref:CARD domain-containing protein n=1 Tax=Albula goreensis TaxID=1534307 RepID=A0A8T3D2Z5_9TELE|nr:hypothetical protein AGOR_G00153050 [Albula goreensis]